MNFSLEYIIFIVFSKSFSFHGQYFFTEIVNISIGGLCNSFPTLKSFFSLFKNSLNLDDASAQDLAQTLGPLH